MSSMPFRMTCYKKISSTARCYSDSIDVTKLKVEMGKNNKWKTLLTAVLTGSVSLGHDKRNCLTLFCNKSQVECSFYECRVQPTVSSNVRQSR